MIIGVTADTHLGARPGTDLALPRELLEAFRDAAIILHAGDLVRLSVLAPLHELAEVTAVIGNSDSWDVARHLPERTTVTADTITIGLVHGHVGRGESTADKALSWFPDADVVVFGHSHRPLIEQRNGQLLINPGSPTQPRGAQGPSCARLHLGDGAPWAELVTW